MPAAPLQRHTFVTVDEAAWSACLAQRPDLAVESLIADWVRRGFPLIVRRGVGGADDGLIALGLPLPPALGKRRIAVALPADAICAATQPPLLSDAAVVAPAPWQRSIAQLVALSPGIRCFGSLAWQYLTGLSYLSAGSDLDLLWPLSAADIAVLLAGIAEIDATAPMRIDGEIITLAGGVNWRELHEGATEDVLVKGLDGVILRPRAAFLAGAAA
jgi:phosphoribosyl-dephospho-CoA transferase